MKVDDIDLQAMLEFEPDSGRVFLGQDRMLVFRQDAMAELRYLLFEHVGERLACATLAKFGYRCGEGDFKNLSRNYRWDTEQDEFAAGPAMHTWEGIVHVRPTFLEFDRDTAHFHMTGIWLNSYEAEIHVKQFGLSKAPVCHSLTGYASGWCSAFFDQPLLAIETRCAGMGDEHCEFEIRPRDAWGEEADPWRNALEATDATLSRQLEQKVASRTAELERANTQLVAAKQSADQANQAKSGFLASMSHELRTPMNAIIGYTEMLLEEAEDQGLHDLAPDLTKIHSAGRHLLALINDVLDLSKVEAGKMDLFLEVFELRGLLDDVAATVDALVSKKRNRFVVEALDDLGSVKADLTKLRQMLFNLISNAAKFTEDGCITLSVDRDTHDGADWITYAVSDTGIGIPDDKIGTLFEEFAQAEASTSRDFGGTGLGLSITKRFSELMGGSIEVQSAVGEGSTFTIRLPAELAEPRVEAQREADLAKLPAEGTAILVIDDDATACELIRRSLEREGHQAIIANSGDEGLRLARAVRPLLITLDVMMPGKDGWAVLRELKADAELCEIPVVMISMLDGSEMGLALGTTDYLAKPVDRNGLHALLQRHGLEPSGAQVLVVEDEPQVRVLVRRMLEKEGCSVTEAADGREGLERMQQQRPDLILLDLMMPVMDGFEFAAELRRAPAWRDIPVIVTTAKDLTPEDRDALSGVVQAVLQKNASNLDDFIRQVRGALAH